ncbi:MAG: hypothetical protein HUU50_10310 [Candidatus Brocadiae bacterium]|nr:hypothetical protein [Candidatus Brocadiia bacterium]
MKKPVAFYFIVTIIFLAMNGGAYLFLFMPCLEQYTQQQDEIDAKKRQKKSITTNQEEIQKYRSVEQLYIDNNAFYEKWVRKNFSSTDIKVYLHELGKKMSLKIEPEEKTEDQPSDSFQMTPTADTVVHTSVAYEINAFFTAEQLKNYTYALINNEEKLFLVRNLEIIPVSTDVPKASGMEIVDKEKYMRVRLVLDYVYFIPAPEEEKKG